MQFYEMYTLSLRRKHNCVFYCLRGSRTVCGGCSVVLLLQRLRHSLRICRDSAWTGLHSITAMQSRTSRMETWICSGSCSGDLLHFSIWITLKKFSIELEEAGETFSIRGSCVSREKSFEIHSTAVPDS